MDAQDKSSGEGRVSVDLATAADVAWMLMVLKLLLGWSG